MVTKRHTLHDVAKKAGVSYQTVSRVINNHPYVAEETRQRVQAAIDALAYRPNRAAQSLAASATRTLGLATFGLGHYGMTQMMVQVEVTARTAGYDLIFTNLPDATPQDIENAAVYLRRWQVDGFLFIVPLIVMEKLPLKKLCDNRPVMLIGSQHSAPDIFSVAVDQVEGGRLAAQTLLRSGHRRIAVIRGPDAWRDADQRYSGFLATLAADNLSPVVSLEGDWSAFSGYQATRTLLNGGWNFTALFAANDQMALGALHALAEQGLRVPQDVSVVGYDDIPEAAFLHPPLTTVRQDFAALAQLGLDTLLKAVNNETVAERHQLIQPYLMERGSVASAS
jgi:LacI family transcriptional regulator